MESVDNELMFVEEETLPSKKTRKSGKASNVLAVIAIVWNVIVLGVTAVRALLLPLGFVVSVIVAVFGCVMVLLWSLPLAMTIILLPFLPILGILAAIVCLLAVIVLEAIPVGLMTVGLILAVVSAIAGGKKRGIPLRVIAILMSIVGLPFVAGACFYLTVNALIASAPVILLGVMCAFFLVQLIVIAIGNSAV